MDIFCITNPIENPGGLIYIEKWKTKGGHQMNPLSSGIYPVVLTPFHSDLSIDYGAYRSLLEWYLERGVDGLFAVCLSSEMFQLSGTERLKLAETALTVVNGRVPVVACAGIENTAAERRASIRAMASLPVAAVVLPLSCIVGEAESDSRIVERYLEMFDAADETPVGVYECPRPVHRLFPDETLGELASRSDGRLLFFKDTCCDAERIRRRLVLLQGSGLKLFNADLPSFPDSVRAGCAGYCGISANFYPELLRKLFELVRNGSPLVEELQSYFLRMQQYVECKYPVSAKTFLSMELPDLEAFSRMNPVRLSAGEKLLLETFHRTVAEWDGRFPDVRSA